MQAPNVSTLATVAVSRQGQLGIEVVPSAGCGGCVQKSACGSASASPPVMLDLALVNPRRKHLDKGDRITVSVATGTFIRFVALCYLLPAILMLAGASLGAAIWTANTDLSAILGACSGLMVGCALLRLYDARVSCAVSAKPPGTAEREFPLVLREP